MQVAFITAIVGGYETSCKKYMLQMDVSAEFICFTDNPNITPNGWIIDNTPYHFTHPSPLDTANKTNSLSNNKHTFNIAKYYKQAFQNIPRLKRYDVIIWLDGSVEIIHPFTAAYIVQRIKNGEKMVGWHHEHRNGLLSEEVKGSDFHRYTSTFWFNQPQPYQDVFKQHQAYLQDGYTDAFWIKNDDPHFGVWITCFVAFNNNDASVTQFLDQWYDQTLTYTTQDQIGFPFVVQKTKLIPYTLPDKYVKGTPCTVTDFYVKHNHGGRWNTLKKMKNTP